MSGWAAVEAALDGMLARRWYTNHGPMAQMLEQRLAEVYSARHAVITTNPTIAVIMLLDGLGLTGNVLLSALAPRHCVQAVRWAGLQPMVHDVDAGNGLAVSEVTRLLGDISGILLSGRDDEAGIAAVAAGHGVAVLRDGVGGRFGPEVVRLGGCGEAAGVACILLEDDALAAQLRNIRSSYGAGPVVPVVRTANGRVSEAQAALALLWLDDTDVIPTQREGG